MFVVVVVTSWCAGVIGVADSDEAVSLFFTKHVKIKKLEKMVVVGLPVPGAARAK